MGRILLGLIAILIAILIAPSPTATLSAVARVGTNAAVTTYYVTVGGNDRTAVPNDPNTPYRSPRGAYAAIPGDITQGAGDHVIEFMDSGTYGQLRMTAKGTDAAHRIILRAAAGTTPTMDAYSTDDRSAGMSFGNPVLRVEANHVTIQGLHLVNTSRDTILGHEVMVRIDGSHVEVLNNHFDGIGRKPTNTDIFLLLCNTSSDNVIAGNRFDFSGGKSLIHITASCRGGSPGRQTIRNNVLSRFGNNPQAICAAINFGGSGGTLAGNNSLIENNTIHDNGGGCYGLLNTNGSALSVRNNIFSRITGRRHAIGCSGSDAYGQPAGSSGVAYHSIMFGNTNNVEATCGTGGWYLSEVYTDDPYFVEPDADPPDLHVESTAGSRRNGTLTWRLDARCSSAIDRAPASDTFEREPSPNGGRRNLGAYGNTAEASKSCKR